MSESFLIEIYILIIRSTRAAADLLNQGGESPRNTFAQETNTIGNVTLSRNRAGRISYDARVVTAPQKREGIGVR